MNKLNSGKTTRRNFLKQNGLALGILAMPFNLSKTENIEQMENNKVLDVVIIGGSYSGLSAAMGLGRALKQVLIIDTNSPCNKQTPFSHNFLGKDGWTPSDIAIISRKQVAQYATVDFLDDEVLYASKTKNLFLVETRSGKTLVAKKLVFATGIKDIFPKINGFKECWGISILHCPFCHGYEVKNEITGILGNGESGFELTKLISNWTNDLTLFTNGPAKLEKEQIENLNKHNISIIENEIIEFKHTNGKLAQIIFKDGTTRDLKALYTKNKFEQHCAIPEMMGCEITKEGYIKLDSNLETTINGVYACGDNSSQMRTVANAVAQGNSIGITLSKKLIFEQF